MKRVLHVGCGGERMPEFLDEYEEVRLDIDPQHKPDIVASMLDMGEIGEFDAVFGSHVLEHFAPHEVKKVISECLRVLKDGGMLVMVVPNLEHIRPTRDVVYESPAGPITGLDMFYGKESFVEQNPFMAHKTGFVKQTLLESFAPCSKAHARELTQYNLICVGVK